MATPKQQYPDHLNPFGSDDEDDENRGHQSSNQTTNTKQDDYPEYLSPFEDDTNFALESSIGIDDYDDSLNPFGDGESPKEVNNKESALDNSTALDVKGTSEPINGGNPFDEEEAIEEPGEIVTSNSLDHATSSLTKSYTPQPESLDPPPVPLPRTKSLLKKEKAQKIKQHQESKLVPSATDTNTTTNSLLSTTSSISSTSISTTAGVITTTKSSTDSFQRKKNKRNAPPVPINFKRQVSGSLDEIEKELNNLGDDLAKIEKEYNLCQDDLKESHQKDEVKFEKSHQEFSDLIRRRNSILRRQKELMYRKRELKLDQIHSDIEYELRMIGNKQLSNKTSEDEAREKDLLKKLVEIVEEKSDIVENLNKDTSCDSQDIEEALRRLNIVRKPVEDLTPPDAVAKITPDMLIKKNNCDKNSAVIGAKLSKIATLLPKSGTLKGTMKIKRKRLFKKCDPRPIEKPST